MAGPVFHHTPPDAVRGRVRERVDILDTAFTIEKPRSSDDLLNHPAVQAAYARDQYCPYWADVWPAARMLAKAVLREDFATWPSPPTTAIEVACGLGVPGIAALARGMSVTFTDIDRLALDFAATNARLNGYSDFTTALVDLRSPPAGLKAELLLASDLLYEPRLVEPVIAFLEAVLTPTGVALIADPDRESARPFGYRLGEAGFTVESAFARAGEPGQGRTKGTVYRVRRSNSG